MTTKQLQDFFEENDFTVYQFEQNDQQCAEVESWTKGGVDMLIYLEPFTKEEFFKYVKDFDVDEEIMRHREDVRYVKDFTIRQSLIDFEKYHKNLKKVAKALRILD